MTHQILICESYHKAEKKLPFTVDMMENRNSHALSEAIGSLPLTDKTTGAKMALGRECLLLDIKVALKVTRLIFLMLLYILLPVKLVCVLPGSHY